MSLVDEGFLDNEVETAALISELQSMWEVPAIAHFCQMFRTVFGTSKSATPYQIPDLDAEQLERALATPTGKDTRWDVIDLHIRLLRGFFNDATIGPADWEAKLREYLDEALPDAPNPLRDDDYEIRYQDLEVVQRVLILHFLCHQRLDCDDMLAKNTGHRNLNELEPSSIRVEAMGGDKTGAQYWYFSGQRLYKESKNVVKKPKKKGPKPKKAKNTEPSLLDPASRDETIVWELVCSKLEDWHALVTKLKCKGKTSEQAVLYLQLRDDFVPELQVIWEREEKKRKADEKWAALPRRVSSRAQKVQAAKAEREMQEEMEKAKEEMEKERRALLAQARVEQRKLEERAERVAQREEERLLAQEQRRERVSKKRRVDSPSKATKPTPENDPFGFGIVWNKKSLQCVQVLQRKTNAFLFLHPVTEEIAPDYFEVITTPCDFGTVLKRLNTDTYATLADFADDVYLIFDNCREYNGAGEFSDIADDFEKTFEAAMCKVFPGFSKEGVIEQIEAISGHPHRSNDQGSESEGSESGGADADDGTDDADDGNNDGEADNDDDDNDADDGDCDDDDADTQQNEDVNAATVKGSVSVKATHTNTNPNTKDSDSTDDDGDVGHNVDDVEVHTKKSTTTNNNTTTTTTTNTTNNTIDNTNDNSSSNNDNTTIVNSNHHNNNSANTINSSSSYATGYNTITTTTNTATNNNENGNNNTNTTTTNHVADLQLHEDDTDDNDMDINTNNANANTTTTDDDDDDDDNEDNDQEEQEDGDDVEDPSDRSENASVEVVADDVDDVDDNDDDDDTDDDDTDMSRTRPLAGRFGLAPLPTTTPTNTKVVAAPVSIAQLA